MIAEKSTTCNADLKTIQANELKFHCQRKYSLTRQSKMLDSTAISLRDIIYMDTFICLSFLLFDLESVIFLNFVITYHRSCSTIHKILIYLTGEL